MKYKGNFIIIAKDGWPLEQFRGRPITNFFRRLILGSHKECRACQPSQALAAANTTTGTTEAANATIRPEMSNVQESRVEVSGEGRERDQQPDSVPALRDDSRAETGATGEHSVTEQATAGTTCPPETWNTPNSDKPERFHASYLQHLIAHGLVRLWMKGEYAMEFSAEGHSGAVSAPCPQCGGDKNEPRNIADPDKHGMGIVWCPNTFHLGGADSAGANTPEVSVNAPRYTCPTCGASIAESWRREHICIPAGAYANASGRTIEDEKAQLAGAATIPLSHTGEPTVGEALLFINKLEQCYNKSTRVIMLKNWMQKWCGAAAQREK